MSMKDAVRLATIDNYQVPASPPVANMPCLSSIVTFAR
jgi:hypothetical protein